MMLFRSLRSTWLTILFWNSVCSQLLYENNNQWNNQLISDSNEASAQLSQERLEALLKETKLESETWRSRYETHLESFNILPTVCKEHVHNVSKVIDICRDDRSLVFPHHDKCQLYYNCSLTYTSIPSHLEQHMVECPYPSLFSTQSLRCENFTDVCCGLRKELKDKCDYSLHSESTPTCNQKYPSCSGKTDGYHESNNGPHSYFDCFKERLMTMGTCDNDDVWNIKQIVYEGQCRNPYEVLHKDGGLLPSCDGKKDGNYANDFNIGYRGDIIFGRICDAYYRCQGGVSRSVKCPNGNVFESVSKTCKPGNHSNGLGCQLYCNPDFKTFYSFPNNFAECPYPEQFSDVTHRCENFTKVACGSRPQVKDYCKYFLNVPLRKCETYTPSCAGLPDGFNINPITIGSTNYIICLQERVIANENCPRDEEWQAQMFPYNGKCTHQYAIPTSWYNVGLLPNCAGIADGHYQYPTRPCGTYYYKCKGWVATAMKCPSNTMFDKTTGVCKPGIYCS